MSVQNAIITISTKESGSLMNLQEYKDYVLATRESTKMSALNAIINSTKKESETN